MDGRTDAVERLFAAIDVQRALIGLERAVEEIEKAARLAVGDLPDKVLDRLNEAKADDNTPDTWRAAVDAVLKGLNTVYKVIHGTLLCRGKGGKKQEDQ